MSNIIKFGKHKATREQLTDKQEVPLFTVRVYRDKEHEGGVVARFESEQDISRLDIADYLDEISWKGKNIAASEGSPRGKVALIITQYQNTIGFVENEAVVKDEAYINNLRQEFERILDCLGSL